LVASPVKELWDINRAAWEFYKNEPVMLGVLAVVTACMAIIWLEILRKK